MTTVISFLWRFSLFYSRSFMSDGPSKYERVIFQIGSQFSSELIQDGRAFWEFFSFFQTIIAGNLFWPSHLSSPKCLHIRYQNNFFSPCFFLRILIAELQNVLLSWCCFFFQFEIYNTATSKEEKLSEFSKKSVKMVILFMQSIENGFIFCRVFKKTG